MPVYTYRCDNCGVQFERRQSFSEAPLTRCPECAKKSLRKVYTPVGIVFKGSGFYSTDHRSPSGAGRSASTSKSGESEAKADAAATASTTASKDSPSSTTKNE